MPYPVVIEEVAASLVAGHRFNTSLARIAGDIQRGFGTLMQGLGKARVAPSGAPLIVYHEVIDQENAGDVELCVPVGSALNGDGAVQTRMLEGGTVATTTHRGPYDQIGPAYHAVSTWIANNGYAVAGPPREIYLNDPMREKPEDLLTRIEYPVTQTAD